MKYLLLISVVIFSGCKITKQIQKTDTETKTESKIDSASTVHNDISKETKTLTETTETIDTLVFVTPKGNLIEDTATHKGRAIPVHVKKKKVTKTNQEVKETDKSKTKTEVKKEDERKSAVETVNKDITKTGITWYWWLIIIMVVALCIYWKFWK